MDLSSLTVPLHLKYLTTGSTFFFDTSKLEKEIPGYFVNLFAESVLYITHQKNKNNKTYNIFGGIHFLVVFSAPLLPLLYNGLTEQIQ